MTCSTWSRSIRRISPCRRGAKPDDPEVLKGKELFYQIGCASCHKPKFMTGERPTSRICRIS